MVQPEPMEFGGDLPDRLPVLDYNQISVELIVALRGKRSRRHFSDRLGYKSNIVQRWETGSSWPKAAVFLDACERHLGCGLSSAYLTLFHRVAPWKPNEMEPREVLVAFLTELRGSRKINEIAEKSGKNRFTVSRWLKGEGEPTLPELLLLVDVMSGRVLDFVNAFTSPAHLPSIAQDWEQLERSRSLAYQSPWGHALLRAIRLDSCVQEGEQELVLWLAGRLGLPRPYVGKLFADLRSGGHIRWEEGRWLTFSPDRVDTGREGDGSNALKEHWTSVALQRLRQGTPGSFGFSFFEISQDDFQKLKALHLEYVKQMQDLVKQSSSTNTVALYCAQLIDLSDAERHEELKEK